MTSRLRLYGFAAALAVLTADQASKQAALGIAPGESLPVTPFFNLVLVWNRGVSFGLFNHGAPLPPVVFIVISLIIALLFGAWLLKAENRMMALSIGAVIGGAIGNVIDRFRFGAVVDFLDFHIAGIHWPAFNVADSAIVVGIALIVFDGLFLAARKTDANHYEQKHADQ